MKRRYIVAGLAAVAVVAVAGPAVGGPSLKSLVQKEVAKQLDAGATASAKGKGKRGPRGPAGAPGATGAAGTARAYARVTSHVLDDCAPQCAFDDAKGVSGVTHPILGSYCVFVPGVNPETTTAVVSVDWAATSAPEGNGVAMLRPAACENTAFEVRTQRIPATGDNTAVAADNVGFSIIIP